MRLQELMNLVAVTKLSTTLLKMLDPVETGILKLRRKVFLKSTAHDISYTCARSVQFTDILFKRVRHKPYTAIGQLLMCLLPIHPEVWVTASILIEEEVAK